MSFPPLPPEEPNVNLPGSGSVPELTPPAVPPVVPPVVPPGGATPPPAPPSGPPVYPAGAGEPVGPANNGVSVGNAFSWAMTVLQKNLATFISLAAVVMAIYLIQHLVGNNIGNQLTQNCGNGGVNTGGGIALGPACNAGVFAGLGIKWLLSLVLGVLGALASIGVYRAALRRTEGVEPSFAMLTTGENLGPYIITALLYGLAVTLGLIACCIGSLVVMFLFQFAPLYSLDKGAGVGEAFSRSFNVVKSNIGAVLITALINFILAIIANTLWGIPTLLTLPFTALFTAHIYRQLNSEAIAPA